jgi:hypothetical protein
VVMTDVQQPKLDLAARLGPLVPVHVPPSISTSSSLTLPMAGVRTWRSRRAAMRNVRVCDAHATRDGEDSDPTGPVSAIAAG